MPGIPTAQSLTQRFMQLFNDKYATSGKTIEHEIRDDGSIKTTTGPGRLEQALVKSLGETVGELLVQVLREAVVEATVSGKTITGGEGVVGTASGTLK